MTTAPTELASVRYLIDDVPEAVAFYTTQLGFTVAFDTRAIADVRRGPLRLLSGPATSGVRATPGDAAGRNRIHLIVSDLDADIDRLRTAGLTFRSDPVSGPGGRQILLADPAATSSNCSNPHPSPRTIESTSHADTPLGGTGP